MKELMKGFWHAAFHNLASPVWQALCTHHMSPSTEHPLQKTYSIRIAVGSFKDSRIVNLLNLPGCLLLEHGQDPQQWHAVVSEHFGPKIE